MPEYQWQEDAELAAHYIIWITDGEHSGAKQPGSFAEALVRAIFKADRENLGRLAVVYPVFVAAVRTFREDEGGYEELKRRAGLNG